MTEDVIERLIQNFNKDFKSNLEKDKYDFLEDLYENYISLNASNELEIKTVTELGLLDDEITGALDKKQLELFNKFDKLKDNLLSINNKHAFIYGFCLSQIISKITDTTRD